MSANYILKNGVIVTVDEKDSLVESIVIQGNKILYTGNEQEAMKFADDHTKVIDLKGKTVTPGFIDSHQHTSHGSACKYVFGDLDPAKAPNKEKLLSIIKKRVDNAPYGEWVLFWGYDEVRMEEGEHPTIAELDQVAPNNPILVGRCCGHVGSFNTMALEIGDINLSTAKNYVEGQVGILHGKLTGQLYESAYYHMWDLTHVSEEELVNALAKYSADLMQVGVTTVHDAGGLGADSYRAYSKAIGSNAFNIRVHPLFFNLFGKDKVITDIRSYINLGLGSLGNDKIKYGLMKIMIDGSSSAPSCAVTVPYCHNKGYGILSMNAKEVNQIALEIHKSGLQATAHCVGDKAIDLWVTAIEEAQKQFPREDARHRIEHCAILTPSLMNRIAQQKMIPIPNTRFLHLNGERYLKFYGDRALNLFPCRSMLDAGIIPAMGTDWPIVSENPLLGLSSAIHRVSNMGTIMGAHENISILEAIRMYTYNCAYATFDEKKKGSLEAGKLADLAVFDGNLITATYKELEEIPCVLTMIDGKIVYEAPIEKKL